jgi:hypothetical protein
MSSEPAAWGLELLGDRDLLPGQGVVSLRLTGARITVLNNPHRLEQASTRS